MSPGFVKTKLAEGFEDEGFEDERAGLTPDEGGVAPGELLTSPEFEGVSGAYFKLTKRVPAPQGVNDPENARRLWAASERLSGLSFPE